MPPHLLPDTPQFRAAVYRAASQVTLKVSACGRWVDIIAVRNNDRVYISTLPRQ